MDRHGRRRPRRPAGQRPPRAPPRPARPRAARPAPRPIRGLGVSDTALHRVTNVLLWQRVEGVRRRAEAATALGYTDPGTVDGTVSRLQQALRAAGLTDAYDATLDRLVTDLAAGPLTDWAARRTALADWTVPDADWAALKSALAPLQKRDGRQPDWDLRRTVIGQNTWEDLTGSEPHASPAFHALTDAKARTRLRNVSQQFRDNVATGRLAGFAPVINAYLQRVKPTITWPSECDPDWSCVFVADLETEE